MVLNFWIYFWFLWTCDGNCFSLSVLTKGTINCLPCRELSVLISLWEPLVLGHFSGILCQNREKIGFTTEIRPVR